MRTILLIFLFSVSMYANVYDDSKSSINYSISNLLYSKDYYRKFEYGFEALDYWSRLYSKLEMSDEEVKIINEYTFGDFVAINDKLRSKHPVTSLTQDEQYKVKVLDGALSKTTIPENILTYRYEDLSLLVRIFGYDLFQKIYKDGKFTSDAKKYLDSIVNTIYVDYGFMSTTVIRYSTFQTRPIELVIKAPRYSPSLFVSLSRFAKFPTQYELLFPRNRNLLIEGYAISSDNKKLVIYTKMLLTK